MLHALSASRPPRRLVALLLAVLLSAGIPAATMPVTASAQSLVQPPQTKEEAAAAEKAADQAADDGGTVPLTVWLGVGALLAIAIAAFLILRDANVTAGPVDPRRLSPSQKPIDSSKVRGAPRTMFTGEAAPGGRVGKTKKRDKSKRQKAARRNNR